MQRFLASVAAGFGLVYGVSLYLAPADVDPMTTASVNPQVAIPSEDPVPELGLFLLARQDLGEICIFERPLALDNGSAAISMQQDCIDLFPDLQSAAFWLQDGTQVNLTAADGRVILTFQQDEGPDFVSINGGVPFTLGAL